MKKDFLSVDYLKIEDIDSIFRVTYRFKQTAKTLFRIGQPHQILRGKTLAMIFAKPSTRTRVSFDVAMNQLGGHVVYLNQDDIQLGRGETIADTTRVLSRYVDGIVARLFAHEDIIEMAKNSSVPVINGLTDLLHPCQALSDMYTIKEKLGRLSGLKLAYVGDGSSNVCHSLMYACSRLGLEMVVGCPKKYAPNKDILTATDIKVIKDPEEAARNADVIYTDTWVSMGQKKQTKKRIKDLKSYQVNSKLLSLAKKTAVVMHCLPAHRGQEITDDVMDGSQSIIFDQAENRLHIQKGILVWLMG